LDLCSTNQLLSPIPRTAVVFHLSFFTCHSFGILFSFGRELSNWRVPLGVDLKILDTPPKQKVRLAFKGIRPSRFCPSLTIFFSQTYLSQAFFIKWTLAGFGFGSHFFPLFPPSVPPSPPVPTHQKFSFKLGNFSLRSLIFQH